MTTATARAPQRLSLAAVELALEPLPESRRRRKIFRSSADGARVEEQGEDVAGEWVDVGGKALLGPENRAWCEKLRKKNEKRRSARWQKA